MEKSNTIIYLKLCFWSPGECKSNTDSLLALFFVSINSWRKYISLIWWNVIKNGQSPICTVKEKVDLKVYTFCSIIRLTLRHPHWEIKDNPNILYTLLYIISLSCSMPDTIGVYPPFPELFKTTLKEHAWPCSLLLHELGAGKMYLLLLQKLQF